MKYRNNTEGIIHKCVSDTNSSKIKTDPNLYNDSRNLRTKIAKASDEMRKSNKFQKFCANYRFREKRLNNIAERVIKP